MRVLIVDDEAAARQLLRHDLGKLEGVEVVGEAEDGLEALESIDRLRPDLVLLDIQMPGLDGFEVLEVLETRPTVIFVTAHDEFALKAFEVGAVDYLLKPFTRNRLEEALKRALLRRTAGENVSFDRLLAAVRKDRPASARLLLREEGRVRVLAVERIDYVEAQGDYAVFYCGAETLQQPKSLAELEEQLAPHRFVRVHRSYLLNLARLERFELYAKDSRVAVLRDGKKLPVSRSGYQRVREVLG